MQKIRLLALGLLSLTLVSCGTGEKNGSGGSGRLSGASSRNNSGINATGLSGDCSEAPFFDELLRLTNQERTNIGLAALTLSTELINAAQAHSQDMSDNQYFSHTGLNGSSAASRAQNAGYNSTYVGENIFFRPLTPAEAITGWMNSTTGHRENILRPQYTEIGFGLAKGLAASSPRYWTQLFGNRPNNEKTPAPASAIPANYANTCFTVQPDQVGSRQFLAPDVTKGDPVNPPLPVALDAAATPEPAIAASLLFFAGLSVRILKHNAWKNNAWKNNAS